MKEIPLTHGKVALVDDEDFEMLSQWKWHCSAIGYAVRSVWAPTTPGESVRMHRQILGLVAGDGQEVDHFDENKLNNQKSNLRLVSRSENSRNQNRTKRSVSGWRGVCRCDSLSTPWRAQLCLHGKSIHGGCYRTPEMAALRYNEMVLEHVGSKFRFFNQVFLNV